MTYGLFQFQKVAGRSDMIDGLFQKVLGPSNTNDDLFQRVPLSSQ